MMLAENNPESIDIQMIDFEIQQIKEQMNKVEQEKYIKIEEIQNMITKKVHDTIG